jgi:drug/metabolite transporter (DMT)-like permease
MLALLGFLGVFANQLLFLNGLARTTATNASILMPSIPAFAAAVALVAGIEAFGPRRLAGVALTIAGALVLVDPTRFTTGDATVIGDLLVLANCLCYASFLVLQRPVLARLPWRTVIAWAFLFGSLGMLPLSLRELAVSELPPLTATLGFGIAFIVVFPTLLAYSLNSWAIRRSSPSLVAAYTTLQPVVAGLLAVSFLGERPSWRQGAGFVLIALGLWLVSASRQRAGRRSLAVPPA